MAFSMFFRQSVCSNKAITSQLLRLASQAPLTQRTATSIAPITTIALKEARNTPILNSVRSFRTSNVCQSAEKGHDHAKLWVVEKAVAALMIPLIPIGLLVPNKITDALLAILISAHAYWGLEAIAVDYVRASVFGPFIPKLALGLVYMVCIATLGGLFYIITHDIGLSNTVRQFWAIKSESQKS